MSKENKWKEGVFYEKGSAVVRGHPCSDHVCYGMLENPGSR